MKVYGYNIKIGVLEKEEIDFICEKNHERIYIQVALELKKEETVSREIGNLLKIKDNYPKYLVTMDKGFTKTESGIKLAYIRDFLTTEF